MPVEPKTYKTTGVSKTFPSCTISLGALKSLLDEFEGLRLTDESSAILQVYPPRGEGSECRLSFQSRGES